MERSYRSLSAIGSLFGAVAVIAAAGTGAAADQWPLPVTMSDAEYLIVGVEFPRDAIEELLPPGLVPTEAATGGLTIAVVGNSYPSGPFSYFYLWIDVQNYDAPSGTPGRFVVSFVTDEKAGAFLGETFGWEIRRGGSRDLSTADELRFVASLDDETVITANASLDEASCAEAAAPLVYPVAGESGLMVVPISFTGEICSATEVNVSFDVPESDALSRLEPSALLWAIRVRNASVSVSRPAPPSGM